MVGEAEKSSVSPPGFGDVASHSSRKREVRKPDSGRDAHATPRSVLAQDRLLSPGYIMSSWVACTVPASQILVSSFLYGPRDVQRSLTLPERSIFLTAAINLRALSSDGELSRAATSGIFFRASSAAFALAARFI